MVPRAVLRGALFQWLETRNSLWLERGVFGSLAIKPNSNLLELACGDGFNARNFYSLRSRHVIAVDFDPNAIATANRRNSAPNVEFRLADIRLEMSEGAFNNIVWDAAIEHFTPEEIENLMNMIKSRLSKDGVLSGYTIVERADGKQSLSHHEYEFKSKYDLLRFFKGHFKHVTVFETIYPGRHNLYFWASNTTIPFDESWDAMARYVE
jgi:cyclopropane fatty-acyl-phospholipid synthase-like methyltransferase